MSAPTPKPDERRLHPSALVIYSADALRNAAFPLLVILGVTLLGGPLDTRALLQAAIYGGIGLVIAVSVGAIKFQTTSYYIGREAIHHLTGALSKKVTDIRLDRIQAIDVHQGPLQRAFGVFSVDIQTGAGKKGGEISLPALTPAAVEELRAARPQARTVPVDAPTGPTQRVERRDLLIAAVTAGQLGIILPVLAGAGQIVQQLFEERRGEDAVRALPHSAPAIVLIGVGLVLLAWLLSTAGAIVTFGGFTVTRDDERLKIRRGFVSRVEATVPVSRVRAVRVVEGIFRRPFGLASLTIEVTGYADEASAARTLFPIVRVRDVEAFLSTSSCPSWPTIRAASPRRRRGPPAGTCCCRSWRARRSRRGAWFVVGAFAPLALVVGCSRTATPAGAPRAGGWRTAGWRSARCASPARPSSPPPASASPTRSPRTLLQRRAGLADLEVAFGKQTTARIRHLEAADARAAWSAL